MPDRIDQLEAEFDQVWKEHQAGTVPSEARRVAEGKQPLTVDLRRKIAGAESQAAISESGAPVDVRLQASLTASDKGKIKLLSERYGKPNVLPVINTDGTIRNVLWRENTSSEWKPLNPEGPDIGDVVSFIPDFLQGVPAMVAAGAGAIEGAKVGAGIGGPAGALAGGIIGGVLGGVTGDVIGSGGRQAVEYAVNKENVTPKERAGRILGDVATGAAFELGGRAVGAAAKALSPYERLSKAVQTERVPTTRRTKEGELVVGETTTARQEATKSWRAAKGTGQAGVDLTAGQASRSPTLLGYEGYLSRFIDTIPLVRERVAKQLEQFSNLGTKTAKAISPSSVGADEAGQRFAAAARKQLETMVEARRLQGASDFSAAEKIAGSYQGIPLRALARQVAQFEREGSAAFASPQKAQLARWAREQVEKLAEMAEPGRKKTRYASIRGVQEMLHTTGEMAASLGELIPGLGRTETQKVGRRLFAAIMQDLDAIVADKAQSPIRAEAVKALRAARDNWKTASEAIEAQNTALIQRALKLEESGQPEDIVASLLSGDRGVGHVRKAMALVDASQPAVASEMRRKAIERLLEGKIAKGEMVGDIGEGLLSPAKVATAFEANRKKLDAILAGDPKAREAASRLYRVAKRLSIPTGAAGSPTAPLTWTSAAMDKVLSIIPGAGKLAPGLLADLKQNLPIFLSKQRLADILTDPEKAKVFLGVLEAPKNMRGSDSFRLLSRLGALIASDREERALTEQEMAEYASSISPTEGLPRMDRPQDPGMSKEDWIQEFEKNYQAGEAQ